MSLVNGDRISTAGNENGLNGKDKKAVTVEVTAFSYSSMVIKSFATTTSP